MKTDYDVLIVGAGFVGASSALALSKIPLRVAIVEKFDLSLKPHFSKQSKPLALNLASCCILQSLVDGNELLRFANPIHSVHISEQGCFANARINAEEMGVVSLGYTVPAAELTQLLHTALLRAKDKKDAKIDIFSATECQSLIKAETAWKILLKSKSIQKTISAAFIIAADGSESVIRQLLNIKVNNNNTDESALVTHLQLARHHQHIAYQRFASQEVLACLPLKGNAVGFVCTAKTAVVKAWQSLSEKDFLSRVQKQFGYQMGHFIGQGERHCHPINSFKVEQQIKDKVILLGNAAHTLSPIAAQGLNLAFQDMAHCVEILAEIFHQGFPMNDSYLKQRFAKERHAKQKRQMLFASRLGSLFRPKSIPLTLLRNSGLLAFDLITPLKHHVSRSLMGMHGRLPALIRRASLQKE